MCLGFLFSLLFSLSLSEASPRRDRVSLSLYVKESEWFGAWKLTVVYVVVMTKMSLFSMFFVFCFLFLNVWSYWVFYFLFISNKHETCMSILFCVSSKKKKKTFFVCVLYMSKFGGMEDSVISKKIK